MVIASYTVLYIALIGCAAAQLALVRRENIPFCPGAAESSPTWCRREYAFLIFTPIWTFIAAISSALHWIFISVGNEDDGTNAARTTYCGLRCCITFGLWIGAVVVAILIKEVSGYILGPIILVLYLYLFMVEWVPRSGTATDNKIRGIVDAVARAILARRRALEANRGGTPHRIRPAPAAPQVVHLNPPRPAIFARDIFNPRRDGFEF